MRSGAFKTLLIVPALVSVSLLTSCNFVNVTKPSFSHYQNEIPEGEWVNLYTALNGFFADGLDSLISTVNTSSSYKEVKKNSGGKEIGRNTYSTSSIQTFKFDKDNQLGQKKIVRKEKQDVSYQGIYISSKNSKDNETLSLQVEEVDNKNCLISINKKAKYYSINYELGESYQFDEEMAGIIKSQFFNISSLDYYEIEFYSSIEGGASKYYLDDTIYTRTYSSDYNGQGVVGKVHTKREIVIQYDFADNMTLKCSDTCTHIYTEVDQNLFPDTASIEVTDVSYFSAKIDFKPQTLRRVNISGYDRVVGDTLL